MTVLPQTLKMNKDETANIVSTGNDIECECRINFKYCSVFLHHKGHPLQFAFFLGDKTWTLFPRAVVVNSTVSRCILGPMKRRSSQCQHLQAPPH